MRFEFIAGFGPVVRDPADTHAFWSGTLGIELQEMGPGYFHARDLAGANVFGFWPLSQAAQATFGTPGWPAERPVPQAWIEFEVGSPEAVAEAVEELRARGQEILTEAHQEPWGQWTARLMSPEGLLVGVSYMAAFHTG